MFLKKILDYIKLYYLRFIFFICIIFSFILFALLKDNLFKKDNYHNTVKSIIAKAKPLAISETEKVEVITNLVQKKITRIIKKGDTLGAILGKLRVENQDINTISEKFNKVFKPINLKIKDRVTVTYSERTINNQFDRILVHKVKFTLNNGVEYEVAEYNEKFYAYKVEENLIMKPVLLSGEIKNSLYNDAIKDNVPIEIILSYISLFSYDLDFQRDIRKGDKYKVFFETYYNQEGELVKYGDIIYLQFASKKNNKKFTNYRFINDKGVKMYLDETGTSLKKSLLRTPINGARISSGYGYRKHPILGYTKLHKGIDFAAPYGTPVYAAGSGKVVYAGWFSSYGKYIKIKHNNAYESAYAHLSKIASSVKKNRYVKQGDIIGYVGSTGRSTGPHLHYEIHKNKKSINPNRVKPEPQTKIKARDFVNFDNQRKRLQFIISNSYAKT